MMQWQLFVTRLKTGEVNQRPGLCVCVCGESLYKQQSTAQIIHRYAHAPILSGN